MVTHHNIPELYQPHHPVTRAVERAITAGHLAPAARTMYASITLRQWAETAFDGNFYRVAPEAAKLGFLSILITEEDYIPHLEDGERDVQRTEETLWVWEVDDDPRTAWTHHTLSRHGLTFGAVETPVQPTTVRLADPDYAYDVDLRTGLMRATSAEIYGATPQLLRVLHRLLG